MKDAVVLSGGTSDLLAQPKVLLIHNAYQRRGGEDVVFEAEEGLLRERGHIVTTVREENTKILEPSLFGGLALAGKTVWSKTSYATIVQAIRQKRPDVAHIHNTFPLISPSAYYACHSLGVPLVQTLHNYRLFCPKATFYREHSVCEECTKHSLMRSVRYCCYRDSRAASVVVAAMLATHRGLGTWNNKIDCYVALTEFARQKFVAAGLPVNKVAVKPNFVLSDPGLGCHMGRNALFVGRLSEEKGLPTLLHAWTHLRHVPIDIVGEGPLSQKLQRRVHDGLESVRLLGPLQRDSVLERMKSARFLVFPSSWYEGFPMTLVEAFACGLPVIVSRLGAMEELVADGLTGLHFRPGDPEDLAAKVKWAWAHPGEMAVMGKAARAEFEGKYTANRNYAMLMEIYQRVIGRRLSQA